MTAVLIICILTVVAMIALVLFEPRLHPRHAAMRIFWIAPLLGALVLFLSGKISGRAIMAGLTADTAVNPLKILVLFFAMTLMSLFLDEAGFFRVLAGALLRRAGGSQTTLFFALYATVSALTVFTSNDIIVLTFTPFICYFCKNAHIDPLPYLICEFVAANTWSMALIIGNPTNIYLAAGAGVSFASYTAVMLLPTVLAGAVSFGMLWLIFHRRLREPIHTTPPEAVVQDKPTMLLGLAALGGCLVFLVLSSYLELPMWKIAAIACVMLYVAVVPELLVRHRGLSTVRHSIARAPFDIVPFVLSMFVLVLALDGVGATATAARLLAGDGVWGTTLGYGIASFLTANLVNNIPMSVLFSSIAAAGGGSAAALYAAVIGSNIGAFLTPVGALAGIMWMSLLKVQGVSLSFLRFLEYGALVSIPSLLCALAGLAIVL